MLKKKTKINFKLAKTILKFVVIILPSSALTAFVVSLCDYVFPLFITLVIGGTVSVFSFVLLGACAGLIDLKMVKEQVRSKLKTFKVTKKTSRVE